MSIDKDKLASDLIFNGRSFWIIDETGIRRIDPKDIFLDELQDQEDQEDHENNG